MPKENLAFAWLLCRNEFDIRNSETSHFFKKGTVYIHNEREKVNAWENRWIDISKR